MTWLKDIEKAAKEVLNVLGEGYHESVYEEALAHELRLRQMSYERQRNFEIIYKGYRVGDGIVDLIINPRWCNPEGKEFVLEVKKANKIQESYKRQAQVYMISLNVNDGAVLSFSGEILLEAVQKPEKTLNVAVVKPGRKMKKSLDDSLKECVKSVFDYFGREFTFRDDRMTIFTSAIGVELRLRKVDFSQVSHDITYKSHKVSSHSFDFVFEKGEVAEVDFYEKEEKIAELKDELKFNRKLFGLSKAYLIAFPKAEKGNARVIAV
jgi:GxxExxY protein